MLKRYVVPRYALGMVVGTAGEKVALPLGKRPMPCGSANMPNRASKASGVAQRSRAGQSAAAPVMMVAAVMNLNAYQIVQTLTY